MATQSMLDLVYDQLDYKNGQLFDVKNLQENEINEKDWLDKGEWLETAKRAGAERLFFVDNNPIVVFARCLNTEDKVATYNKLWCLARPRILFLESPGELAVIDLAQRPLSNKKSKLDTLKTIKDISEVAQLLQKFNRDSVESGKVYEYNRFGNLKHRADMSLISDLKTVRRELIEAGLDGEKVKYAHALIGRSIFIRYLEDRKIITKDYFDKVAGDNEEWRVILEKPVRWEESDLSNLKVYYPRVLQNKDFTYKFFEMLSKDFNGDMFPNVEAEKENIKTEHLTLIQGLLYGDTNTQQQLFFFSYKFDIIPLDLISAIYEEFYHTSSQKANAASQAHQAGAYYTPPVLAEFLISKVLTCSEIEKSPRIIDPACGSGIFLVEAFRRIVRYQIRKKKRRLEFDELKEILKNQIYGIELNDEAARITAFSLYLAMLHYLEPTSIQEHITNNNKLPPLLNTSKKADLSYKTIIVGNAFIESESYNESFDLVVGNPPWGSPGTQADVLIKKMHSEVIHWCEKNSYPIGDTELSQAFLWLGQKLLKQEGSCAMLNPAGVLLKTSNTTLNFRKYFFGAVQLQEVYNFTQVRNFFFKGAKSPFVLLKFAKTRQAGKGVDYWCAKQVTAIQNSQAVLFSKLDYNYIHNQDLTDQKTWKINWFGRNADVRFLKHLVQTHPPLSTFTKLHSVGYKVGNKSKPALWLKKYKTIINTTFSRYDEIEFQESPDYVERHGKSTDCYEGIRIIIKEGIAQKKGINRGKIIARYDKEKYSFTSSFHVIKLKEDQEWQYKLLLGCLWSLFARYFFFIISAHWGVSHDKILLEERLIFPVELRFQNTQTKRIIEIVDKLMSYKPEKRSVIYPENDSNHTIKSTRVKLEAELDKAVCDYYGFTIEQRDLIRDCCEVTLPNFYKPKECFGVSAIIGSEDLNWIRSYAEIFSKRWQPYLEDNEVLRAKVHLGASNTMLAFEFYPTAKNDNWDLKPDISSWQQLLSDLSKSLRKEWGSSQILLEGIVLAITDISIIILKRNEKQFWTRSLAREDAESTLNIRMMQTMPNKEVNQ